jgi:hypothetical protein
MLDYRLVNASTERAPSKEARDLELKKDALRFGA